MALVSWRRWRRGSGGWTIVLLMRLGNEGFRARHAAVTGTAGDGIGGLAIGQLGQVFGVDVVGHPDHHARLLFDRIRIGGEIGAFCLRVACVTEGAFDAEVTLVLVHKSNDLVSRDVFGESLDVGGIGTRSAGLTGPWGLGRRWSSGRG